MNSPKKMKVDNNASTNYSSSNYQSSEDESTSDHDATNTRSSEGSISDEDETFNNKRKVALQENQTAKRIKIERGVGYSGFAQRMMASMGYKPGMGLGASGTGITAPIEESVHKGRRGLGYDLEGLEKNDVQWELEEINYEQQPVWMPPCSKDVLTEDDMVGWLAFGKRKDTIEDETNFCDTAILAKILSSKSIFDQLGTKEFLDARQRSNPFETIKGVIFQNRAAMKMANIDSVFNYMFTSPKTGNGTNLLKSNDILYFADLCAGPGGFSEYVFWRKKWHAKGFGMTLKDPDSGFDFKLDDFFAGLCETFDPHYGVGGYQGDGDITKPENIDAFREYVLQLTDEQGVHFVMADGGISVEGQENIQEILTKQLVLCQYLCALSVLRVGGHFVCKVFDMFTPFSVGIFYLLYRCFQQVCIFKPVTSRPANSERYVVCRNLLPGVESVQRYLWVVNDQLRTLKDQPTTDVIEVVPIHLLQSDIFYDYISQSNDSIGLNQIIALKKLRYYVQNSHLQDTRQSEMRNKCLDLWNVPNTPRVSLADKTAKEIFDSVWKQVSAVPSDVKFLDSSKFQSCNTKHLPFLVDPHSWKWYFACGVRFLIVGLGRNRIWAWETKRDKATFSQRSEFFHLELPRGTILEVERVSEMTGEDQSQKKQEFIYILDVLSVHDQLFAHKPLKERLQVAEKLCKVLNKPCRQGTLLLKVKKFHRLNEMNKIFEGLTLRKCKHMNCEIPTLNVSDENFIAPTGVIFCKVIKDPWQLHLSKSGQFYFFNCTNRESHFNPPQTSVATYLTVIKTRQFWQWNKDIFPNLCGMNDISSTEFNWTYLRDLLDKKFHPR